MSCCALKMLPHMFSSGCILLLALPHVGFLTACSQMPNLETLLSRLVALVAGMKSIGMQ